MKSFHKGMQTDLILIGEEYGAYCVMSIFLLSLLFNIGLLCRIEYGDIIITKYTTRPYKISLVYLTCTSTLSGLVAITAQYKQDDKSFAEFSGILQALYDVVHTI